MSKVENVFKKILESEDLLQEFLQQDNMDEMYDFFLQHDASIDKDEFDDFVSVMLEDYMHGDFNVTDEMVLDAVSGGSAGFGSKLLAGSLAALALLPNVASPAGAKSVGDRVNAATSTIASKSKSVAMGAADLAKKGWHKTSAFVKAHPTVFASIAAAVAAAGAGGAVTLAVNNKKSEPSDDDARLSWAREQLAGVPIDVISDADMLALLNVSTSLCTRLFLFEPIARYLDSLPKRDSLGVEFRECLRPFEDSMYRLVALDFLAGIVPATLSQHAAVSSFDASHLSWARKQLADIPTDVISDAEMLALSNVSTSSVARVNLLKCVVEYCTQSKNVHRLGREFRAYVRPFVKKMQGVAALDFLAGLDASLHFRS